jgi:hypothetical protein
LYREWSDAYGGKKWAECTDSIIQLDRAIQRLVVEPCDSHVQAVISALNISINCAHNGGWWMDKFSAGLEIFVDASQQKIPTIAEAARAAFQVHDCMQLMPNGKIEAMIEQYKQAAPIVIEVQPFEATSEDDEDELIILEDDDPPEAPEEPEPDDNDDLTLDNDSSDNDDPVANSSSQWPTAAGDYTGLTKVAYTSSMTIEAAHVRFSKLAETMINAHIQFAISQGGMQGYCSRTYQLKFPGAAQFIQGLPTAKMERSYSSTEGEYLAAQVYKSPGIMYTLIVGDVTLVFNSQGLTLANAAIQNTKIEVIS